MAQSRRVVGEFDLRLSVADVLVADEKFSNSSVVPTDLESCVCSHIVGGAQ
jgi:hypothetical protein